MIPLNAKKCEIAKIRPAVSGNFFQLVKIFYYFASEIFSCLLRGKTVKRNQSWPTFVSMFYVNYARP